MNNQAKPFKFNIPQDVLDQIMAKVEKSIILTEPKNKDWSKGSNVNYMAELVDYWKGKYNWRKQEALLNNHEHFLVEIGGRQVHFIYVKGKGANPRPLLLTHGWPDSFYRFDRVIPLLTNPGAAGIDSELSFDVIIPSLPGFGFSDDWPLADTPDIWAELMTDVLGYDEFFAAGGDIGAIITKKLAEKFGTRVKAIHLSDVGLPSGTEAILGASEVVRNFAGSLPGFLFQEGAFLVLQGSKPQTLAFALNDSPIGYAAWVVEKFYAWTDNNGDIETVFSKDELLTHIMIYLVTGTIPTSLYTYYEWTKMAPTNKIDVPSAVALFPKEPIVPPKEWIESCVNLQKFTEMAKGGHFGAWEVPGPFCEDLRSFFNRYW